MGYYKIKNITNLLSKRHLNKDSMLEIEYSSGYKKESFKLNVRGEAYIEAGNLPINIHKLRMKKMISVREVSKNEFFKKQKPPTTKKPLPEAKVKKILKETTKKPVKKRVGKRIHEKIEPTVVSIPEEK